MMNLRDDLVRIEVELQLQRLCGIGARPQNLADFAQGEAELLAFQNELQMCAVAIQIEPRRSAPARMQKAAILVKPQSPKAEPKLAGNVANGKGDILLPTLPVSACPSQRFSERFSAMCPAFVSMTGPSEHPRVTVI